MLDVSEAVEIARAAVESQAQPDVIISPLTAPVVTQWSVMVFYNTRAYFEGDVFSSLAGNGPVVVDRRDGTVRWLGTYDDAEVLLAQLESDLGLLPCAVEDTALGHPAENDDCAS